MCEGTRSCTISRRRGASAGLPARNGTETVRDPAGKFSIPRGDREEAMARGQLADSYEKISHPQMHRAKAAVAKLATDAAFRSDPIPNTPEQARMHETWFAGPVLLTC